LILLSVVITGKPSATAPVQTPAKKEAPAKQSSAPASATTPVQTPAPTK
ncbi:MAG: preprotein translocase subunit SecG, partial [Chryseobacterium gambrini]|nr:preprotein translocase subunit SecG [Chryseobacterium gambrini]